jgi:hypothetical protein
MFAFLTDQMPSSWSSLRLLSGGISAAFRSIGRRARITIPPHAIETGAQTVGCRLLFVAFCCVRPTFSQAARVLRINFRGGEAAPAMSSENACHV